MKVKEGVLSMNGKGWEGIKSKPETLMMHDTRVILEDCGVQLMDAAAAGTHV